MKNNSNAVDKSYWFVGPGFNGTKEETNRFIKDGIWSVNLDHRLMDKVKLMQIGEKIIRKSTFNSKNNIPFDNKGHNVSVMSIDAIGTIIEKLNDGLGFKVKWDDSFSPRKWYCYTSMQIIWQVQNNNDDNNFNWAKKALLEFILNNQNQNFNKFCNNSYWKDRYGDGEYFHWTSFYEAIADKLIKYANDRTPLVSGINKIRQEFDFMGYLDDKDKNGLEIPMKDICPFTVMTIFNRGISDINRILVAQKLAEFLGVKIKTPVSFEGIPILPTVNSKYYQDLTERNNSDIDNLWKVFVEASKLFSSDQQENMVSFINAYDTATKINGVKWNLSFGLYWAFPWDFMTLDGKSRKYIKNKLGINVPNDCCNNAYAYLQVLHECQDYFLTDDPIVKTFPNLSLAAYEYNEEYDESSDDSDEENIEEHTAEKVSSTSYTFENIMSENCFIDKKEISNMIETIKQKHNLILQGPPGTGKTWLAKKLAFAVIGQKNESNIKVVQFHQNLSYEDFIRGWRPAGDGKLYLADGVFMQLITLSIKEPSSKFVLVIEEINRGNPSMILGEMLTLLESDKRNKDSAIELCYHDQNRGNTPVYIPDNLYIIGTMNIADRSLALLDLALRRRFAFITLQPQLGELWEKWLESLNFDKKLIAEIKNQISNINKIITENLLLGKYFSIGHSYVTPPASLHHSDAESWYKRVLETEIKPLLDEYCFNNQELKTELKKIFKEIDEQSR